MVFFVEGVDGYEKNEIYDILNKNFRINWSNANSYNEYLMEIEQHDCESDTVLLFKHSFIKKYIDKKMSKKEIQKLCKLAKSKDAQIFFCKYRSDRNKIEQIKYEIAFKFNKFMSIPIIVHKC